jgi:hydroxymethylpyrimidine pyrophosphatase-like HAD family hydrolase
LRISSNPRNTGFLASDFHIELDRVAPHGIIQTMNKQQIGKESLHVVPRAWLFDVDGVITNPAEKKVTEEGLIEAIAGRLDKGEAVTLNTGRSISWMMDRVIRPIQKTVSDEGKLDKFLAVGEKGGTWLSFQNGQWETHVDEKISLPSPLQDEIRELINTEFKDCMFYDDSKLTMISTEMIDGHSISEYTQRQQVLTDRMKSVLSKPEYQGLNLKIDPTTIATDIQNSHVGKHLGARRIVDWLKEKAIQPQHILTIGDSQSDTEMAEELQDEYDVEFVFVGDPSKLNVDKLKSKPVFTTKRFGEGTLEFLQSVT